MTHKVQLALIGTKVVLSGSGANAVGIRVTWFRSFLVVCGLWFTAQKGVQSFLGGHLGFRHLGEKRA